jgi:hypothetical protein
MSVLNEYGVTKKEYQEQLKCVYHFLRNEIAPIIKDMSFEDMLAIQDEIFSEINCFFASNKLKKAMLKRKEKEICKCIPCICVEPCNDILTGKRTYKEV